MKRLILFLAVLMIACSPLQAQVHHDTAHGKAHQPSQRTATGFEIPSSLKEEHKELHAALEQYTKMSGKTGAAAKEVAQLLHPHFVKEEEYALPPLGLLSSLAKGRTIANRQEAIAMSDKLKGELQQMLAEHQQIVGALQQLQKAAKEERHPEVVRFTESLKLHAQTEEQVLYPAAILVGEYLKLKS